MRSSERKRVAGIDLHTHSRCSDGTTTPTQTVVLAAQAGLAGLALTDHDTMQGWAEAAGAAARLGIRFVPGIELSTELCGRSVHVLGYYVDPTYPPLVAECDRLRNERLRRAEVMLDKLRDLGIDIPLANVLRRAGGAPIGRPHVAAELVDAGRVPDLDTAFDEYLGDGAVAYVPKHALAPEDGAALIAAAGGVAVLAHPGVSTRDAAVDLALLDRLVAAGLRGVEADHAAHDDDARWFWRRAAAERDLRVTGGSDFHGTRKDTGIGAAVTDPAVVDALLHLAARPAAGETEEAQW
ncbi:MAG: PHP domain-containing protein [Nitriliruptorales bacterium]|nr:PHP domain-containing protein [Nitriliruptorales bacterium]